MLAVFAIAAPDHDKIGEYVMKERGKERKRFIRQMEGAAAILLVLALHTGCSRERMDTRREIDRIYKAAEQTAEDRAAAYITEKYGIDASPQGYWVQGYHDFFASYINSNVVVFMEYDSRKFCAGIDVYEVTEKSPDSNYATVMHVSEDFMDQYKGTLYILSRNRETGGGPAAWVRRTDGL